MFFQPVGLFFKFIQNWNAQHGNRSRRSGGSPGSSTSGQTRHSWKHRSTKRRHAVRGQNQKTRLSKPFYSDLSLFYFYTTAPKGAALKKQFTPSPLCAALGLYIAKALKPIVLLGLSVSFYLLLAVPLIVFQLCEFCFQNSLARQSLATRAF